MLQFDLVLALLLLSDYAFSSYNISDDVSFGISWSDELPTSESFNEETIPITTVNDGSYDCSTPKLVHDKGYSEPHVYNGKNESELLQSLFSTYPCSTRHEPYWTYELCHNVHVRQFHEDLNSEKLSVVQEYFLGFIAKDMHDQNDEHQNISSVQTIVPTIIVDGATFPYFEVKYVDGTKCDLTNTVRTTSVLYLCHEGIQGAIYRITEVETCSYQVIFLTNHLCTHPSYMRKRAHVNKIHCRPRDGSPVRPKSLVDWEEEQRTYQSRRMTSLDALFGGETFKNLRVEARREDDRVVYRIRTVDSSALKGEKNAMKKGQPVDDDEDSDLSDKPTAKKDNRRTPAETRLTDERLRAAKTPAPSVISQEARAAEVYAFLRGRSCLSGQAGWWQHEVCFNKIIRQLHVHSDSKSETVIVLGKWDEQAHRQWLQNNPRHRPSKDAASRTSISLYYGDGDMCDQVKARRHSIVRLRCLKSQTAAVHMSYSEPETCHYSVLLESELFCKLLPSADEDGIIPIPAVFT